MELTITGIGDKGNLSNERIGLKATKDCDLQFYQLFKTTFQDNGFINRSNSVFWFAPLELKSGDTVVVYTKKGTTNQEKKPDGTTVHWLYWGLTTPIFTDPKHGLVLAEIKDWDLTREI